MNILEQFDHPEKKQNKEHFLNLIQVANADGRIDTSESEMLHRFGRKMGFTDHEIDTLIETSSKSSFIPVNDFFKRFEQVYEIVKIILADGVVDENEMRLASAFAMKLGFNEAEIPKLLNLLIDGIKEGKDDEDLFELFKRKRQVI